jgi:hypothetical protein
VKNYLEIGLKNLDYLRRIVDMDESEIVNIFKKVINKIEPYVIGIISFDRKGLEKLLGLIRSCEYGEHFRIPLLDILRKKPEERTIEERDYVIKCKRDSYVGLEWID